MQGCLLFFPLKPVKTVKVNESLFGRFSHVYNPKKPKSENFLNIKPKIFNKTISIEEAEKYLFHFRPEHLNVENWKINKQKKEEKGN
ncbi:CLUMA_CG021612, isoform A [Clunio marinus]|uniref:CLUMA_CG021612, isoform A n=1 Tax=Clunio marinus TaxID=568069 RepID=A0A1J1J7J3_9DIPT|nr:CLUMA_CG021612, isoform A [Clunio marinus]